MIFVVSILVHFLFTVYNVNAFLGTGYALPLQVVDDVGAMVVGLDVANRRHATVFGFIKIDGECLGRTGYRGGDAQSGFMRLEVDRADVMACLTVKALSVWGRCRRGNIYNRGR